jgi:hypothetical protein
MERSEPGDDDFQDLRVLQFALCQTTRGAAREPGAIGPDSAFRCAGTPCALDGIEVPMAKVPWSAFMRAVRAAGFVTLAESRAFVVLGRADRTATIRRMPVLDEPTLREALRALKVEAATFLAAAVREPIRVDLVRPRDPAVD